MKQKRKVKSLLSLKKNKKELFLMNLLLILSVSLCIGSALLITTSVGATADDTNICPNDICSYTGLDDKSEVLYRMDFVDPENLEKTVNSMYIKDANFYITSGPVIVNPATADETDIDRNVNKVGSGVYSHILGGSGNEVYSDNITIIAGENNKISSGNDNATILGGKNNNLSGGKSHGTPIISLGGENNKVGDGNDGVALIGGEGNEIGEAVSNTFILGGKNNKVSDTENVIVGGSDVTISGTKNIFVYSNSGNFEPKTDNAFYLNVIGGVGINGTGSVGGMAAENAVSIGDIDINNSCNEDNLGVVGSYQGCLVGCTQKGKEENKWELLDRGSGCIDICSKNDKCIAGNNITGDVIPTTNYDAQCTTGYVDITNAELCPYMNTGLYKNVIFETNLVDSDDPCPFEQENQCVYKCKTGFHLTGDVVSHIAKCYRDCEYNWADAEKQILKHNEVVVGYNTGQVYCSNDAFNFPSNQSPETCANNNHKWNLVCKDGTMYLANKSDGKVANTGKNASANGYIFRNCEVGEYKCNTSVYNLNRNYILGTGKDTITSRNTSDRKNTNGTRGVYKLCLDYNPESGVNNKCNIINGKASDGGYTEHYKLIKCQDHYSTGTDNNIYECKQDCTLTSLTGLTVYYKHNKSATGYVSTGATCTGSCQATALVCNDGKWRLGSKNGPENTGFLYNDCTLHPKKCDASIYNVTGTTYLERSGTSIYESCESYNPNGKFQCDYSDTTYHLIDCKEGYHTDNGKWCISNKQPINCNEIGKYKPEEHSAWIASTCEILKDNNEICEILKVWKGTRKTGDYTTYEPDPYCEWDCIGPYHKNSDKTKCISNSCGPGMPQGTEVIKGSNTPSTNGKEWVYTGSTNPGTCEWTCKTGYTRAQDASGNRLNYCVEKQCGDGLPISMDGVLTGKSTYTGADDNRDWTYNSGTLGVCQWKCADQREKSGNGCIPTVNASCGRNPQHFKCGEGTPTNQQTGRDGNTIKGWTWNCMGTPGGNSQELCIECNTEQGYSRQNNTCVKEPVECGGTKPEGSGIIANGSISYYNGIIVGYSGWTYISNKNSVNRVSCSWSCDEDAGYVVNSDKTGCISNALPVCGTGIDVVNKNPVSYSSLCDSSSTYSDWYSGDTDYNTKAGRQFKDGCGPQSWTRTCKHKVSGNETRCQQNKKIAYFGIQFTPGSHIQGNGVIGILKMGPSTKMVQSNFRNYVDWFSVDLKITSKSGQEGNLSLAVTPVDANYSSLERVTYTLRVSGTPGYGEVNTIGMPNEYLGGDMSVEKIELVAIHPRGMRKEYIGGNYVQKYDELAYESDLHGSKYCEGNTNGWLVYQYN